uniref:Protein kinase domain-containing protein n=1 Tax=Echeneis naucrates TaxID=173247 RepID=A0A665TWL3_ECHNA
YKNSVCVCVCIKKMDILKNGTACYMVLDFKGEGVFGKVAKCLNLCTRETVAVKIHKKSDDRVNQREVTMLEALRDLEPDKKNIVRFIDHFRFKDFSCLAFEMLDMSLWDIMKERKVNPLTLSEIRPVTQQLFVAFDALKSKGIMHTDLKPDNIKLIDFGLARPVSEVKLGSVLQPCPYRSPEVYLGLPLSEAVDMWAVGCLMAHMYFGLSLFPGNCPYNWMKAMVHLLGQPEDQQLNTCMFRFIIGSLFHFALKLPHVTVRQLFTLLHTDTELTVYMSACLSLFSLFYSFFTFPMTI